MLKRHYNLFAKTRVKYARTFVIWSVTVLFCASVTVFSGCEITQRGKTRPMIQHDRIEGDFELYTEKRSDEHKSTQTNRKSDTLVFQEKLTLKTKGDVYHPNLLFYSAAVGVGLAQQKISSTQENGNSNGKLVDYNLFAQILRTKKYPITLHTNRSEDLVSRQFLGSLKTEREGSGITATWKSEEWPMKIQYSTNRSEQQSLGKTANDFFIRDDKRFTYSLKHNFSESSHMSFDYEKNDVTQNSHVSDVQTSSDRFSLLHDWSFGKEKQHRLGSYYNEVKQTGTFNYQNKRFQERLNLKHKDNFSTHYDVTFIDSVQYLYDRQELRTQAGFEHKFYDSVTTLFDLFSSKAEIGAQGDVVQNGAALTVNYNKKNRFGTFIGSYASNFTDLEQNGKSTTRTVPTETHTIDPVSLVPTVMLNERNINTSTIVVMDKAMQVIYVLGDDYTISPLANGRVQLVIDLAGTNGIKNGDQIIVSYSYSSEAARKEETLRQNLTFRQMFNNGISMYYEHSRQNETVSSTTSLAIPDEYTANTYGIEYSRGGLLLLGEYRKEDSNLLPSEGKRVEARYSWSLTNRTRVTLHASDQILEYGEPDARKIDIFRFGAELYSKINERYSLSALLDYQDEEDTRFGNTKGFQFNAELQYTHRQIKLTTGLEINSLQRREDKIDNTFVYCRLKRFF